MLGVLKDTPLVLVSLGIVLAIAVFVAVCMAAGVSGIAMVAIVAVASRSCRPWLRRNL